MRTKLYNGYEATHDEGPLGFHGGGKKNPTLVDSWETKSPGKTIVYTIKMTPSRTAYVYECLVVEKSQRKFAARH